MTTPVPDGERVQATAQHLLECVEAAALGLSATLPAKRYLTSGRATHDCEQVAITCGMIRVGRPGSVGNLLGNNCPAGWSLSMTAEIVRSCAPTANARGVIDAASLTAGLGTSSLDAAILMQAISQFGGYSEVTASISLAPPMGSFLATVLTTVVPLL